MDINLGAKFCYQRFYSADCQELDDGYEIARRFESDRGRIINSAAIRRLQQKTQVFPLERNAAVRSRLTHSMEVQQVGRHIAKEVIHHLKKTGRITELGLELYLDSFESIVEMACLMHDIGNPPFGHFGESAINDWFSRRLGVIAEGQGFLDDELQCQVVVLRRNAADTDLNILRGKVRIDLCNFEGNAQAIRLIHTLLRLNLTYAQIACVFKYTRPAYWTGEKPKQYSYLMKKPGYYWAEESFIHTLQRKVNIKEYHRFPLTYIMEAADDISYCVADLEDAVEKNIFTVEQLYNYLKTEWNKKGEGELFATIVDDAYCRMQKVGRSEAFFMYLRVNVIKVLVPHAADRFCHHLESIVEGAFNEPLIDDEGQENRLLDVFKNVARSYVFNHHEVEQLELQGYRVITGLLDIYSDLLDMPMDDFAKLVEDNKHKKFPIETRLFHKLSGKHLAAYREAVKQIKHLSNEQREVREYYYRARLIQDYISGMTDLYAYDEYRRLMAAE